MIENQTSAAAEKLGTIIDGICPITKSSELFAISAKYKIMEEALERIGQPIEPRPIDSGVDAGTFYISQATDKVRIAQEALAFDPLKE